MKRLIFAFILVLPAPLLAKSDVELLLESHRSLHADPFCERGFQVDKVCLEPGCESVSAVQCGQGEGNGLCCPDNVLASSPSCRDSGAPCVMPFEDTALVPDYSFAGYRGGGVKIPSNLEVKITLSPTSGDDTQLIQNAIDRLAALPVDANGFRGVLLLGPGAYHVSKPLKLRAGGVVVRGSGTGEKGTVLIATGDYQYSLFEVKSTEGFQLNIDPNVSSGFSSGFVPAGAVKFKINNPELFKAGQRVLITRTPNQAWVNKLNMDFLGHRADGRKQFWKPKDYIIHQERTIVKIQNNWVTLDIPIVDNMDPEFGGGLMQAYKPTGRLNGIGVEHLEAISIYTHPKDEKHAWTAISFNGVSNSWVKNIVTRHFGYAAVMLKSYSNFNTIEDVAHINPISKISGSRRYSFYIGHRGGMGNLFQRCFAKRSRHALVTGARVAGPNVWLHCYLEKSHADDGPHHRWSTGLLFDSNKNTDNKLRVQNRYDSGTGHGWTGAQVMSWNNSYKSLVADKPPGSMNWIVGGGLYTKAGSKNSPQDEEKGIHMWPVFSLTPQSLYLYQLEQRLGFGAVTNIATTNQLKDKDSIIEQLIAQTKNHQIWDDHPSDPICSRGLVKAEVCLPTTCSGVSSEQACSSKTGEGKACCPQKVKSHKKSCFKHQAPCVIPKGYLP